MYINGHHQTTPACSTIAHNGCGCADLTAGFPFDCMLSPIAMAVPREGLVPLVVGVFTANLGSEFTPVPGQSHHPPAPNP